MKTDPAVDEENILVDPADHGYNPPPFAHLKDELQGEFWDSARKHGKIIYDVGSSIYFDFDGGQHDSEEMMTEMFRVSEFPQWPTTAGHIEFPLSFGFSVVLIRWEKWFDYPKYKLENYP